MRETKTLEMAEEEENDPYASISYQCIISSSQENLLQHSSFSAHGAQQSLIRLSTTKPSSPSPSSCLESDLDEFPVESTGIMICSLPDAEEEHDADDGGGGGGGASHPMVEEEYQTPEEQFLICASEKEQQPRRMEIDEYLASRTHDADAEEEAYEDVGDGRVGDDTGTVDLGKESNSVFRSREDFSSENGSPMMGTVPDDDVEKCNENEDGVSRNEPVENEISITKSPMHEDLGFVGVENEGLGELQFDSPLESEKMLTLGVENEGLGESPCNNPIESEKVLTLDVVSNVEPTKGEDVSVETLELLVEKKLGVLKCSSDCVLHDSEKALESKLEKFFGGSKCNSDSLPCDTQHAPELAVEKILGVLSDSLPCDSEKAPKSSMRKSQIQEDVGLLESKNEGLGESPSNLPMEVENNSTLVAVDNVELPSREDFPVLRHSDVPESSKDIVMEDSSPNEIQKVVGHDMITDNVPDFDNMQTDELHDDGKPSNNSKEELEKSEHADSGDLYPEVISGNPAGLRRLPNWTEVWSDSAMKDSTQNGNRRARKEKNPDLGGKKREAEILGHGGIRLEDGRSDYGGKKRLMEVESSSRVPGEVLGHDGIRLVEGGSDHGGKRSGEAEDSIRIIEEDLGHGRVRSVRGPDQRGERVGEALSSSRVSEALPSVDQPQAVKNLLDAIYFRVNQRSRGTTDNANGNNSQEIDILEVATRAGLKISRPRWWKRDREI